MQTPKNTPPRPGPGRRTEIAVTARVADWIGARVQGTTRVNMFRAIGRARRNFLPWMAYSSSLMPFGELPRTESELIILRVAALREAHYELDHHRTFGKRAGLSATEIAAVQKPEHGFTGRVGALLDAVDDLVARRQLTDEVWTRLRPHIDDAELTALLLLVTNYDGLATVLDVLDVPLDPPRRARRRR
ncbi:carboxymuconolactone decarboxylase family protein [Corynebacterium sp.]|uniref:carboxymuconolactone decarboxylase family protein n=1 Tax=Corynebacterium sp. TaxID=1720 RepID=UPI002A91EB28|nr:carboxymuconolactone decarboxylase family protein [Corynebacterium sp.]MDY5786063.1 carboxymuconolactone decarboxylase family protein [Corynebacterium sp.]